MSGYSFADQWPGRQARRHTKHHHHGPPNWALARGGKGRHGRPTPEEIEQLIELRRMGATNALTERRRTPLRRATLARVAEIYARRFADPDGKIRASFEVVWLSGWAPHESQQKPLRPGSAQARLADALGTREIGTGEKAGS